MRESCEIEIQCAHNLSVDVWPPKIALAMHIKHSPAKQRSIAKSKKLNQYE